MSNKRYNKILVIGDVHTPFQDDDLLEQIHDFNRKFKADLVLATGDMLDQKAFGVYPKSPKDDSPALEFEKATKACIQIGKMFPKMTILNSNHDRRYLKRISEAGIPSKMVKTLKELIPNEGWTWHLGPDPLVINNSIACVHGDELQGRPILKAEKLGYNLIQGHTHQASIQYSQTFDKKLWALDAGCVVDAKSAAFDYASGYLSKIWTGYGFVENGVPHLVPKKK